MRTAKLMAIEHTRNHWVYADAELSDGSSMQGLGYPSTDDPTGKYEALWDLAQRLSWAGVEVE